MDAVMGEGHNSGGGEHPRPPRGAFHMLEFALTRDPESRLESAVTNLEGVLLLETPIFNKGSAFPESERRAFGLDGLLPPHVTHIQEQVERVYEELSFKPTDMEKHIFLRALQDRNEVLFYRLLLDHIEEMLPLIYTPIVGWACRHFSHIYRRPRGLFIPFPQRDRIPEILGNRPFRDVDVIVVTDGERILGLGDQGVGGMGISIGKLSLYTLCGGIHPARTLPVILDCGTDNRERLEDAHYLGWRHPRVRGKEYLDFVEAFVSAVEGELPRVLLQWEDFSRDNASLLLSRYRDRLCTFNDDIQGTAAVTVAALLSAARVAGVSLRDLKVVLLGAGSASVGIADLLTDALVELGVSPSEAAARFWLLNSRGLIAEGMDDVKPFQERYLKRREHLADWTAPSSGHYRLEEVVRAVRPNVLIGVSGQPGAFTETIVREMARSCERPVILPLSNPTSQVEAKPEDILRWTDGRAIVATGSPFPPVEFGGRTHAISQCNNSYVFPGLGLGVIACGARRVSPSMFMAAAKEVSRCAQEMSGPEAILPPLGRMRDVSLRIAKAVAAEARRVGFSPEFSEEEIVRRIDRTFWHPAYPRLIRSAERESGASVTIRGEASASE